MSKEIGRIGDYVRVEASGAGVEIFGRRSLFTSDEARALAALFIQGATEVERMRGERASLSKSGAGRGLVEARCYGGKGGPAGPFVATDQFTVPKPTLTPIGYGGGGGGDNGVGTSKGGTGTNGQPDPNADCGGGGDGSIFDLSGNPRFDRGG